MSASCATLPRTVGVGRRGTVGDAVFRGWRTLSTERFVRAARKEAPRAPSGELSVQAPPDIPRPTPGNLLVRLLPLVMVAAMVGMMALMFTSGMARSPMAMIFPIMMVVSMVGMLANGGRGGTKTSEVDEDRKDYLRYLDQIRREVTETSGEQRKSLEWAHPDPALLWTLVGTARMWERRSPTRISATSGSGGAGSDCHPPGRTGHRPARRSRAGRGGLPPAVRARPLGGTRAAHGGRTARLCGDRTRRRQAGRPVSGARDARPVVHLSRAGRPSGSDRLRTGHRRGMGVGQVASTRAAPRRPRRCGERANGLRLGPRTGDGPRSGSLDPRTLHTQCPGRRGSSAARRRGRRWRVGVRVGTARGRAGFADDPRPVGFRAATRVGSRTPARGGGRLCRRTIRRGRRVVRRRRFRQRATGSDGRAPSGSLSRGRAVFGR